MRIDGASSMENSYEIRPQSQLDNVIIKLASRCNLNCTYCYWFRDKSVYQKPKLLLPEVQQAFINKLRNHIVRNSISSLLIAFHGGEPLLFGKNRLEMFCKELRSLSNDLNSIIDLCITTNGVLIDDEWCRIFKDYNIHVALSLDGDQELHDTSRKDFKGKGTYNRVVNALNVLRSYQIEPTVLSVCSPTKNPLYLIEEFVGKLNITYFDVIIPDKIYGDVIEPVGDYFCELFDLWYDKYANQGVVIRMFDSIIKTFLGGKPLSNELGYGPVSTFTLMPDGKLEAIDTVRIAQDGFTQTAYNVFDHEIDDIVADRIWNEVYSSSINLAKPCQTCVYKKECGGGAIQTRWSKENRFNNTNVYCSDLKKILDHISTRISSDLYVDDK
jgi:uncharacterized protein